MARFTGDQLIQLKTALRKRYGDLKKEVRSELVYDSNSRNFNITKYLNDIPDDIDTALVDRQVSEMRELEISMKHLSELEFGDCIDCGDEIDFERLLTYPSAQWCIDCQHRYEKAFPQESNYSL